LRGNPIRFCLVRVLDTEPAKQSPREGKNEN
jgi:hypothetical protein